VCNLRVSVLLCVFPASVDATRCFHPSSRCACYCCAADTIHKFALLRTLPLCLIRYVCCASVPLTHIVVVCLTTLNADDKIILEQEWFFLASSSPYESHLYKTLNNSDEAMTTKTELFNPGKDCVGCGVRCCSVAVWCVV
jgi:hypothetical protein